MIHLDYETFSKADLKAVGEAKYAEHPSTEILMCSISKDDGPTYLWVNPRYQAFTPESQRQATLLLQEMEKSEDEVWVHSVLFEFFISNARLLLDVGVRPPGLTRWRCTAALARRAGLPGSLDGVTKALQLTPKDKRGTALIRLFSIPDKEGDRTFPWEAPEKWHAFCAYCIQDTVAEKAVHHALKAFSFAGALLESFQFDLRLNARGIPVNKTALRNANDIVNEIQAEVRQDFYARTHLNPTQGKAVLRYLQQRGCPVRNLKSESVAAALESVWAEGDQEGHKTLELYSLVQYAAVKKIPVMLGCACNDGWVRGGFKFYGAGTGRQSGQLFQPHNFKRPVKGIDTHGAYKMLCEGRSRDEIEMLHGDLMEVLSSTIRHFIQWPDGPMLDADYSAIEARIICWLAGQEDALQRFREFDEGHGTEPYVWMARKIFNSPTIDSDQRELGKRTILGCGFNMGWRKFQKTCRENYGIKLTDDQAQKAVSAYRKWYHKVVELWGLMEKAARRAIAHKGTKFQANKCYFIVKHFNGLDYLLLYLPSGRPLVYPRPMVETVYGKDSITFYGQIKGKVWGRVSTYGGKLAENATQAVAADIMLGGAKRAEKAGFDITMLVHDQAVSLNRNNLNVNDYVKELTTLPPWAAGCPIHAKGRVVPYYMKS